MKMENGELPSNHKINTRETFAGKTLAKRVNIWRRIRDGMTRVLAFLRNLSVFGRPTCCVVFQER
jgi:hypothetical protein